MQTDTPRPFTPETTREALVAACEAVGLEPAGAELVRMGENALYRLKGVPVMARVGRSIERSQKEINVARWLTSHSFPVVAPADVRQGVVVTRMSVTFWDYVEQGHDPARAVDLGYILRELHQLPMAAELSLPLFDPMPKVDKRLRAIGPALPQADYEFIAHRKHELRDQFGSIEFELEQGPIHGDAHRHNLLRDYWSGDVKLIDLEDFSFGPREWDVCVEAVGYSAFGWITESDYRDYVDAYGFDPLLWPGFQTIRSIRELNMTTWLAQRLGESEDLDTEVFRRIKDLRDEDAPREWRPF